MKNLAALLFAFSLSAAEVVCVPPGNSRSPCDPPATYVFKSAADPSPLGVRVRFGGEIVSRGQTQWVWIKDVEYACTPKQANEPRSYGQACRTRAGEVLMVSQPFRVAP